MHVCPFPLMLAYRQEVQTAVAEMGEQHGFENL